MSVPSYTYYVTIGAVETQVYPSGDWSLKVVKAEEDFPYCKDYRIKFDGDFIFAGEDYDLLITSDCCDKIDLRIQCDGENYWYGYFAYPYDFDVNEDRCTITGTPKSLDKYYYFDLYADDALAELERTDTFTYQRNFPTAPAGDLWSICLPCEPLWDIITTIATYGPLMSGGFVWGVKSAFFNDSDDGFPSGPYPVAAGNNYVTDCPNKLDHIVVAMARDVCNLDIAPNLDPMPSWSWNDVMTVVHDTFNTWWYIDENGDVRVEHIYFWELYFGTSYDLTVIDTGRWIVNTSKYDFQSEKMPRQERWEWSDMIDNFYPAYFDYSQCFLPGTSTYIKEYSLSDLVVDLEYIADGTNNFADSPDACDDISVSDYIFIRCLTFAEAEGEGYSPTACDYCAWFSEYLVTRVDHVNAHLSPANLLGNYWMHDRPFWEGTMVVLAGTALNFESTWKNLRQMELAFPVCCDGEATVILEGDGGDDPRYLYQFGIDFLETITTQYGNGELYTGTIKDGTLSVELIFEDLDCEESATEWLDICEL